MKYFKSSDFYPHSMTKTALFYNKKTKEIEDDILPIPFDLIYNDYYVLYLGVIPASNIMDKGISNDFFLLKFPIFRSRIFKFFRRNFFYNLLNEFIKCFSPGRYPLTWEELRIIELIVPTTLIDHPEEKSLKIIPVSYFIENNYYEYLDISKSYLTYSKKPGNITTHYCGRVGGLISHENFLPPTEISRKYGVKIEEVREWCSKGYVRDNLTNVGYEYVQMVDEDSFVKKMQKLKKP